MFRKIYVSLPFLFFVASVGAQDLNDNFYVKVLKEELNRNIKRLSLPNLGKPFFIGYRLRNNVAQTIRAERGQIVTPFLRPVTSRMGNVKLLIGDYHRNFDHLINNGSFISLPAENDADEIKRAFWLETDRVYKNTAQQYNATMASLKRVTVDQKELDLHDLSPIKAEVKDYGAMVASSQAELEKWTPHLAHLSALFIPYPKITASACYLTVNNTEEYFVTSEGTVIRKPSSLIVLTISASLPGEDGSNYSENYNEAVADFKDLPSVAALEQKVKAIITILEEREKAAKFEGSYLGPVLFEGNAVAGLISNFFRYQLGVVRKSILYPDNYQTFYEDKLGQKLIANDLSLTALPTLKEYNGIRTTGSFDVDFEGVAPGDSLVLIKDGILKRLLNGRTPTKKFAESQGFSSGERGYSAGVLSLTAAPAASLSVSAMKAQLVKRAKEEGLPYAYIVRGTDVNYNQAAYVYRVDTATLKEEMLTGFKFSNLNMRSLRRFAKASTEMQLKNYPGFSMITPESILLDEVELEAENNVVKAKPIIVSNPLLDRKTGKKAPVKPKRR